MDKQHHPPPPTADDEAAWHALVDGRLSPQAAAQLRHALESQAGAEETVSRWQQQRQQLRALHQDVLAEPVPDALVAAAWRASARHDQHSQWWRWGGVAASVLMAFALGWTGRSLWPGMARPDDAPAALLAGTGERFAQQAAVAHAVYQPEVRHPVEVPAAQQDHLVQWLSKRLGRPLKLPALANEGYELVGGRLLPGDAGARAQFMYQNARGERITLYLGAMARPSTPSAATSATSATAAAMTTPGTPAQPNVAETAFQFSNDGPVPSFYWVDQGFGYALSGQLTRQDLLTLAAAVHRQL